SSFGARPLQMMLSRLEVQLSFDAINFPVPSCSSRVGSAGFPVTGIEGPRARMITVLGALPLMIKPPIATSLPSSVRSLVDKLAKLLGPAGVGAGRGWKARAPLTPEAKLLRTPFGVNLRMLPRSAANKLPALSKARLPTKSNPEAKVVRAP